MISYFGSRHHMGPLQLYLHYWAKELKDFFHFYTYGEMENPRKIASGTAVFSDLERLGPYGATVPSYYAEEILNDGVRVLNYPDNVLGRRWLLNALSERGINGFRAFLVSEVPEDARYPLFLRSSRDHTGAKTDLLYSRAELEEAVARNPVRQFEAPLLAVEWLDVGDRGYYRKYSYFRAGGDPIPHHVMFRRHWMVKGPSLAEPWMVEEERAFQLSDPHAREVREVFELAGVDYGRMDYGVVGGKVQVWEINTNPTVLYSPDRYVQGQLEAKRWFSGRLNEQLRALA